MKEMTKEFEKKFLPISLARAFKEIGYNEECMAFFTDKCIPLPSYGYRNSESDLIATPLWQDAIDWLREKHNIVVNAEPVYINTAIGSCHISCWLAVYNTHDTTLEFDTYRSAREYAIGQAIKLIKSSKK